MRTNLIIIIVVIIYCSSVSASFASSWNKKTLFSEGKDNSDSQITNEETPESSTEGLYAQHWADENNIGLSMTAWLQTQKNMSLLNDEINGRLFDLFIEHEYQWSLRNPPLATFSCDWTVAFYMQNTGNCDNRSFFNNKGKVDAYVRTVFNFNSGPEHIMDTSIRLSTSAERRESKSTKSPKGTLVIEVDSIEPNWDDKPDKGKKWQAATCEIISYSVGMDNISSDNILARGALGSETILKLQNEARSAYTNIFSEISGFELELDNIISESVKSYRPMRQMPVNNSSFSQIKQIWNRSAVRSGLSKNSINQAENYLNRIPEVFEMQTIDENLLTHSIERYLEQFGNEFEGENQKQVCYSLAWLLAQVAKRKAMTSQEITNTRASFESLVNKLLDVSEQKANIAIGISNSPEIKEELNENLAQVKGRLLYYFYELRNDPLFPLFKKPIDSDIENIIIEKLEKENIFYNLLNKQIKTEPREEFYSKWLDFYFDSIPERIIFWLVIETNKDEFRNPQYWGGMHHRAKSCDNGVWPIEIHLTRIQDQWPLNIN